MRLVGKGVDIRELTCRFKQRAGVLGRFCFENKLVFFNHDNINKADHSSCEERQFIRAVGRILVQRPEHKGICKRARCVKQAVCNRQAQRQPRLGVFIVGALLPLSAQFLVLCRLDNTEADRADAHQRHRADHQIAHGACDRLVQCSGQQAQNGDQRAGGIADRRRNGKFNVPQADIAQRHGPDVQKRHGQIRPNHAPCDDGSADEDLIRRMNTHHDADGNDHLERVILIPPVAAADFRE